jgi:transposase
MRKGNRTERRRSRHVPGQKPRGCFHDRVKKVSPEHFAIIPVDCGKDEARIRVADFYGSVLLQPFSFQISRSGLDTACCLIRETFQKHQIRDCVCALESTGRYHRPIKQAFKQQQWDTREVHPFTSNLIRRSADLGTKTDDVDLAAIHRAAVDGLAMRTEELDVRSQQWRLLVRHRRDLVEKAATLKVQLQETIHAYLPGFTRLWKGDSLWDSPIAGAVATAFPSAQALRDAPDERFREIARDAGSVMQKPTIDRIRAWTYQAAPADEGHQIHHRRACSLWKDLCFKRDEIRIFELDVASFLCQSPYVLLLAFPGINVVAASDYGAELGPITNYANSKSIAGRAGLYPARYQTSYTDYPDGPLVARRNRQLRAALMRIARNLGRSNIYFMGLADSYQKRHPDHDSKVAIARSFSRLSYYLIAGGQLFTHASLQDREKILQKLLQFFQDHAAQPFQIVEAIDHAMARLSPATLCSERATFQIQSQKLQTARRTGHVVRLGEILPAIILRIDERIQKEVSTERIESESLNKTIHEDATHGS